MDDEHTKLEQALSVGEMMEAARKASGRRYWKRLGGFTVLAASYAVAVLFSQSMLVATVGGFLLLAFRHVGAEDELTYRLTLLSLLAAQQHRITSHSRSRDESAPKEFG